MKKLNIKKNIVFIVSIFVSFIIILYGAFKSSDMLNLSKNLLNFSNNNFGALYLLVVPSIFIFLLYIAFSRYGNIRLGGKDAKPEYSTFSRFAMLFCVGTGIGLVFWSIKGEN